MIDDLTWCSIAAYINRDQPMLWSPIIRLNPAALRYKQFFAKLVFFKSYTLLYGSH